MNFYETVVLKNYKVYKKDEKKNVLQNALPFIDDFLLQTWNFECIITDEFLQKNKDIKNYDDIKRLNDKYKKMVEIEINSRIDE